MFENDKGIACLETHANLSRNTMLQLLSGCNKYNILIEERHPLNAQHILVYLKPSASLSANLIYLFLTLSVPVSTTPLPGCKSK
jgi:hypothetical protein